MTELSQEPGDYTFKFVSISDAACPVHKTTFELLQTVHVSRHTRARNRGKATVSADRRWLPQSPIHVLQAFVCFHLKTKQETLARLLVWGQVRRKEGSQTDEGHSLLPRANVDDPSDVYTAGTPTRRQVPDADT